jgi:signal transduction histidine kinase
MLLARDAGPLNEEQEKYLKEIYIGSKRMDGLVDTFLDVSRLELGTFIIESEPTDVTAIIKSVIDELKPEIEEKHLVLNESYGQSSSPFLADQNLLRIIFQNLLSNALKYTPRDGTVNISVAVTPKGQNFGGKEIIEDSLSISVTDSGIGIPADQKDKIFTKLFRADNAKESQAEGIGLGLYILKSIVNQSGGNIWFESPPFIKNEASKEGERGTTFYIVFPTSGMKGKEV